jgi:Skp family chaperone for outer membrane proteins
MTVKTLLAIGALSSFALASAAFAQAPAPAAVPAASPAGGPPLAGVCTYRERDALLGSTVGQATTTRLKQLAVMVDAELQKEGAALQTEQAALQALTNDQRQQPANTQRIQAFNQRAQNFEQTRKLRAAEIEATQNKHLGEIQGYITPIIGTVVASKGCSLLMERNSLYYANPQMDITEAVVTQLNAKIQALPQFDRERIDPNTGNVIGSSTAAAPAAAAAPPAAATTTKKKKQ